MKSTQQAHLITKSLPKRRNSTKSIRTRDTLKRVAKEIFEREGHGGVTAQAVSAEAKFSYGTFYKYFKNKDSLLFEICSDYFEHLLFGIAEAYQGSSPFIRIFSGHSYYISEVIENWRFHKSFLTYSLDSLEMGDLVHAARMREADRTAIELVRLWKAGERVEATFSKDRALMTAHALNSMTEGYLLDILRPSTAGKILAILDIKTIAFELSRAFYRGAFLEEPDITIDQLTECQHKNTA
jgi:AcrR family transcriptional regulator